MNKDQFNRRVDYLRIAVISRCNFSCKFCSPQNYDCFAGEEDLTDSDTLKIVEAAVLAGFKKLRLTGGEVLQRPNIISLITKIKEKHPQLEISLTTNGSLLANFADKIKDTGIARINVNLPSMNEERFKSLTGTNCFSDVITGISAARNAGLEIKLNVVALNDLSEKEVLEFAKFANEFKLNLRFIELMPLATTPSLSSVGLRIETLREWILKYEIDEEVIAAFDKPFCETCNRLRISSVGDIYPCLFGAASHDLKPVLNKDAKTIASVLREAIFQKPSGYETATVDENSCPTIRTTGG